MKKILFIATVVALVMQSCSTNKMFSHKRYGHLNWIDHNTKVETNGIGMEPAKENATDHVILQSKTESETGIINSNEVSPINEESVTIEKEVIKTPAQKTVSGLTQFNSDKEAETEVEVKQNVETPVLINKVETINKPASPKMDETVKLIICVILCLIIPPLAMYIWNQSTDKWFVIDLILFLCWFLLIIGPFGFLAIGSIVIAFLRVFDLI